MIAMTSGRFGDVEGLVISRPDRCRLAVNVVMSKQHFSELAK
jgi:hypothetical protein